MIFSVGRWSCFNRVVLVNVHVDFCLYRIPLFCFIKMHLKYFIHSYVKGPFGSGDDGTPLWDKFHPPTIHMWMPKLKIQGGKNHPPPPLPSFLYKILPI